MSASVKKVDFSKGKVWVNIMNQSLPLLVAQLVQLAYNIVDRIFIGHMPGVGSMALTGVGLAFPLTTLITAFTVLYGNGGMPLFSMARGAKQEEKAENILNQVFLMLITTGIALFALCYIFRRPVLYLFGASDESYSYADIYLRIYLTGILFSMLATGLNNYINAQGFPKIGMATVLIGALMNLILDPVFIFALHMGVAGAALATVISQAVSFCWVMYFFLVRGSAYRIHLKHLKYDFGIIKEICALGLANFVMQANNCLVQVVCNATLRIYGGDIYVGVMTVLNSVREVMSLPTHAVTNGSQPVISFNYGAKKYRRVRQGIKFMVLMGTILNCVAWAVVMLFPLQLMQVFTEDAVMVEKGAEAIAMYFSGFFLMVLQFAGQSSFSSLGCAKRAIFFSLLRKAFIVVPLTLILPALGLGVTGVFLAEPISNLIGGVACFTTMYLTLYRTLPKEDAEAV